jgi:hypothetical protein
VVSSQWLVDKKDIWICNLNKKILHMKVLSFILIVFLCCNANLQAQDVNNISTMRMGIFKLKTTVAEIEKLIGQKLKINHAVDNYLDTAKVNFDKVDYILSFVKRYNENEKAPVILELYSVTSSTTKLKTKSGVGINSTKTEILAAYDKFSISIYNDWNYKEKGNAKDKIQHITLSDFDAGTQLVFITDNRIVKSIEVTLYEGE